MARKSSRRRFLKQVAGAAGASVLGSCRTAPEAARTPQPLPPHTPVEVPGVHGYAEKSLAAGETLHVRMSSTLPYQLSICRLGTAVDDPASDQVLHAFPPSAPGAQPIHPGSYVHIDGSLPSGRLTLEVWLKPWSTSTLQGIFTQDDGTRRCGLYLADPGRVFFRRSGTDLVAKEPLPARRWSHLVATWDGSAEELWIDGRRVARREIEGPDRLPAAPIRLGAAARDGLAGNFLDGDLAMPVVYARVLTEAEIARRFEEKGLKPPEDAAAWWPLSEERGERAADAGPRGLHGRIVNRGTWMVGGPGFDGSKVARYGLEYDPAKDTRRGHGLRLASDDLYDCRWDATHEWRIPEEAKPGLYGARAQFEKGGKPFTYWIPFVVRKPAGRPRAPILVLCSSNTWLAYNSTPFGENAAAQPFLGTDGAKNSAPLAPAWSCYRDHRAGQPTYQLGLRVPWPSAGPDVLYSPKSVGYSHLLRAERFLHAWLETSGYAFDVVSDLDLHADPGLLAGYKTLVINGHSEYWSREALEGVDRYLKGGGTAVVLSGNTMFWRVSFDGDVMECRKLQADIGGRPAATAGETYHSHDGKRGSLLRHCGLPAWDFVGLECIGWAGTGKVQDFGVYRVEAPDHFLFQGPEPVGLAKGETFGHAPGGGLPRAVGHEWDVRLATLRAMTPEPVPDGALLPAEPAGIVTLARGIRTEPGGTVLDLYTRRAKLIDNTVAEMIYWERPQGGRVFHAGAIGAGWALSADPKLQALLRNVLRHFGAV